MKSNKILTLQINIKVQVSCVKEFHKDLGKMPLGMECRKQRSVRQEFYEDEVDAIDEWMILREMQN